ncbi:YgjP family zinc-dependent metalloprotease [Chitinibacter tainanensis]|uniref:YgjP family zinc-dependent metalloprotease n=1 Tax=Chitinibacter tainanensis TaxID=230667 RepID=UPI00040AD2D4|nr:SprT family zinc-dependent metalloprotease [Chitinibacter tainanensis]
MPQFQYGQTLIEWRFELAPELKRHYITVERGELVLLRGPEATVEEQAQLIRQRARWICEKQQQVNQVVLEDVIVTGSRLRYAGRSYYVEVQHQPEAKSVTLRFTASRFVIENPAGLSITNEQLAPFLTRFYMERAHSKLLPRLRYWEKKTGLLSRGGRIKHFQGRWASCDTNNIIEFHPRIMEFSAAVQDYIIVHELCHTIEKSHSKAFWILVSQHIPSWKLHHEELARTGVDDF